jgi:ABC-type sulfate transport system permease subunit
LLQGYEWTLDVSEIPFCIQPLIVSVILLLVFDGLLISSLVPKGFIPTGALDN